MYTKPETFYGVVFRKSSKSYRANNYITAPYEFKNAEAAKKFIDEYHKDRNSTFSKFCEAIIVEFTNKPIKTINLNC